MSPINKSYKLYEIPLIGPNIIDNSFKNYHLSHLEKVKTCINIKTSVDELDSISDNQSTLNISEIRNKTAGKTETILKRSCFNEFAQTPNTKKVNTSSSVDIVKYLTQSQILTATNYKKSDYLTNKKRPSQIKLISSARNDPINSLANKSTLYSSIGNIQSSNNFIQRLQNQELTAQKAKKIGNSAHVIIKRKKSLNKQVKNLENRIRKLQLEEFLMAKRIKETANKTNTILQNKQRYKEKLIETSMRKSIESSMLEERRNKMGQDRETQKIQLNNLKDKTFQNKMNIAHGVKLDNQFNKLIKSEIEKKLSTHQQNKINKVKDLEINLKLMKIDKENTIRERSNNQYIDKLAKEMQESMLMEKKLAELEKFERGLFENLSNTYIKHKSTFEELEKAYNFDPLQNQINTFVDN